MNGNVAVQEPVARVVKADAGVGPGSSRYSDGVGGDGVVKHVLRVGRVAGVVGAAEEREREIVGRAWQIVKTRVGPFEVCGGGER